VILDNYLPNGQRTTKLVYGRIVSNTFTAPKIETFPGYNMTIQEVPPLNGNGAHITRTRKFSSSSPANGRLDSVMMHRRKQ